MKSYQRFLGMSKRQMAGDGAEELGQSGAIPKEKKESFFRSVYKSDVEAMSSHQMSSSLP